VDSIAPQAVAEASTAGHRAARVFFHDAKSKVNCAEMIIDDYEYLLINTLIKQTSRCVGESTLNNGLRSVFEGLSR
jgi:hypothetical protein